jgi:hypothetical protein
MAIDYRMIGFGFGPVTGREQELVGKVPFEVTVPAMNAPAFA